MRICIDIDGVLCQLKKHEGESYKDLPPVPGAVEKVNALKCEGHYIILYTARRMRSYESNVGKVLADIAMLTLDWLSRHSIPYDELYFGKPWADVYIDDNAFRFTEWALIQASPTNLPNSNESHQ